MNSAPRQLIFGLVLLSASTAAFAEEVSARIRPEAISDDEVRIIRSVVYKSYGESRELLADIYLPTGQDGPFPTILMIHGGAWFAGNKVHVTPHARHAAENGYAVVAINYRLAPIHKFPAQLEDCQSALGWISLNAGNYGFDVDRIAVYGYSAGGHLACLLGLKQDETGKTATQVKSIVAGGTPCEFSWIPEDEDTLAYWLGGSRDEFPQTYAKASPLSFVDPKDPPVYLFHGKSDRVVPLRSAELMMAKLKRHGVMVALYVAEGGHIAAFVDPLARKKAIEFLDHQLDMNRSELDR